MFVSLILPTNRKNIYSPSHLFRSVALSTNSYRTEDINLFCEEECELYLNINNIIQHTQSVGKMDVTCPKCGAQMFSDEALSHSTRKKPVFSMCCCSGHVKLMPLKPPPSRLIELFNGSINTCFKKFIRRLNSNLAFASLQASEVDLPPGVPTFRICGQVHHRISSGVIPDNGNKTNCISVFLVFIVVELT